MKATGNFRNAQAVDPMVALTDATRASIDAWIARFPPDRKRSAVIQGLIAAVAKYLGLPPVWAYEVATFYSMFDLQPVGRHKVAICTNISCWLNGGEDIVRHCENKLGIKHGQSTPDGRVFLKVEEECLAACAGAPMMVVDGHYHEKLTPAKVDALLDGLE